MPILPEVYAVVTIAAVCSRMQIDYIKKGDDTFIDLTLVTNPDQQDEWENRKYIEKLL